MTSRFILNKFDFDFPASGLLVRLGLFVVVVVIPGTVDGICILDEAVLGGTGGGVNRFEALAFVRHGGRVRHNICRVPKAGLVSVYASATTKEGMVRCRAGVGVYGSTTQNGL